LIFAPRAPGSRKKPGKPITEFTNSSRAAVPCKPLDLRPHHTNTEKCPAAVTSSAPGKDFQSNGDIHQTKADAQAQAC
jgi:hypothetical protein